MRASWALWALLLPSTAWGQGVDPGRAPERGLGLPGEGGPERGLGVTREPREEEPVLIPRRKHRVIAPEPPAPVAYEPGDPVPAGFGVERRVDMPWLVTGTVVFGFTYLAGVGVAAAEVELVAGGPDDRPDRNAALYAPIIGSWAALGRSRPGAEMGLLVGHGLMQLGGLSLAMVGLARPRWWLVPTLILTPELATTGLSAAW